VLNSQPIDVLQVGKVVSALNDKMVALQVNLAAARVKTTTIGEL
jgi:hypothetical protein